MLHREHDREDNTRHPCTKCWYDRPGHSWHLVHKQLRCKFIRHPHHRSSASIVMYHSPWRTGYSSHFDWGILMEFLVEELRPLFPHLLGIGAVALWPMVGAYSSSWCETSQRTHTVVLASLELWWVWAQSFTCCTVRCKSWCGLIFFRAFWCFSCGSCRVVFVWLSLGEEWRPGMAEMMYGRVGVEYRGWCGHGRHGETRWYGSQSGEHCVSTGCPIIKWWTCRFNWW